MNPKIPIGANFVCPFAHFAVMGKTIFLHRKGCSSKVPHCFNDALILLRFAC